MNEGKLKTAVLGLNEAGRFWLEAAQKSGYFQIQAVADKDPEVAQTVAREYGCAAYDDYRQLIIQNQFDCLLVAASTHSCDEYLRMAMKKKFHILKLTPPARNFEEAVQFVRYGGRGKHKIRGRYNGPVRGKFSGSAAVSEPGARKQKMIKSTCGNHIW